MFDQIIVAVLIFEVTHILIYSEAPTITIVTAPYAAVLIVMVLF